MSGKPGLIPGPGLTLLLKVHVPYNHRQGQTRLYLVTPGILDEIVLVRQSTLPMIIYKARPDDIWLHQVYRILILH